MPQSTVEIAKELTMALIETWSIPPDRMQETLQQTYAMLRTLKVQEETGPATAMPAGEPSTVAWRKSITRHVVTCIECGYAFKQLSVRHLRQHGLDARSYRTKYGIPQSQPLVARATTERRRQVVQEIRPWEKAPMYLQRQARNATASPEPAGETVPEATEEPSAAAPTQPKRQRKTTSKKKSSPKTRAPD